MQVAHLMIQVGPQDSIRIKTILLTTTHPNTLQTPDKVSSAIGIIVQCFPNIQKATVKLSSDAGSGEGQTSLIADGVAVKLARAFALLERQLPEEEGLVVKGLERQPVLAERWRDVKRRWWDRKVAYGRKVLG